MIYGVSIYIWMEIYIWGLAANGVMALYFILCDNEEVNGAQFLMIITLLVIWPITLTAQILYKIREAFK